MSTKLERTGAKVNRYIAQKKKQLKKAPLGAKSLAGSTVKMGKKDTYFIGM